MRQIENELGGPVLPETRPEEEKPNVFRLIYNEIIGKKGDFQKALDTIKLAQQQHDESDIVKMKKLVEAMNDNKKKNKVYANKEEALKDLLMQTGNQDIDMVTAKAILKGEESTQMKGKMNKIKTDIIDFAHDFYFNVDVIDKIKKDMNYKPNNSYAITEEIKASAIKKVDCSWNAKNIRDFETHKEMIKFNKHQDMKPILPMKAKLVLNSS